MRKLSLILLFAIGCSGGPASVAPPEPPIVTVEKPVERELDSYVEFTGWLKAAKEIDVRTQVTGLLKAIKFTDGQIVKAGHVLYEIDSEPFLAAKQSAQATIASADSGIRKAEADIKTADEKLALAKTEFDRQAKLFKDSTASQREYDIAKTSFTTATSELASATASRDAQQNAKTKAEADLRTAEFNLSNCTIRLEAKDITALENAAMKTPAEQIVARVSRTLVTEGNLVTAGQTVLCRVYSLNPIYAYFNIDETTSLQYRRRIFDEKSLPDPRVVPLDCWIATKDETGYPHPGKINYIAPEVVRGTASREVRGVFDNPDYRLSPGDSVRVKTSAGPPQKKITIPEIAVGMRQQQKFVYVIVNNVAEFRPVVVGPVREINGVRLQIIEKGVGVNDLVVVNGLLRVRPGAPVNAKEQSSPVSPPK